jgi:hypothetical protein
VDVGRALPAFSYGVARTKKGWNTQFFVVLFGRKIIIYRATAKQLRRGCGNDQYIIDTPHFYSVLSAFTGFATAALNV